MERPNVKFDSSWDNQTVSYQTTIRFKHFFQIIICFLYFFRYSCAESGKKFRENGIFISEISSVCQANKMWFNDVLPPCECESENIQISAFHYKCFILDFACVTMLKAPSSSNLELDNGSFSSPLLIGYVILQILQRFDYKICHLCNFELGNQ